MIVVTGAAGFVGRRVVEALTAQGQRVRALLRRPEQASVVAPYGVEARYADIRDRAALEAAMRGATGLVHLAAIIRERKGATFEAVNADAVRNVFAAAESAGVRRAVHLSVIGAAADSPERYFRSRWHGEQAARASSAPTTVIRSSAVFGEGDEFVNTIAAFVRLGPVVPVAGNGRARFQPIDVRDLARACARALLAPSESEGSPDSPGETPGGETLEIGGPETVTYDDIVDLIAETLGRRVRKVHVPLPLMSPAVRLMGALMTTPPVTRDQLRMLRYDNVGDLALIERRFGFKPRPMRGNIEYVRKIGFRDALRITLGRMPRHIRDH